MHVKTKTWYFIIAAIVILLLLPFGLSRFYIYMASLVLAYGLLATSLNFVLGYGGVYQFHQCLFSGVGAYAAALAITKGGLSPWVAFMIGPLVSVLASLIIGLICMRLSKLYYGMLQVSLGSVIWVATYRWGSFTGGDDGIHGIPIPEILSSYSGAYYFVLIAVALSLLIIYTIIKAPFGNVLQGIRDNPVRSSMIGVNIRVHQLLALMISGFFAGIAGVLFVVIDTTVFPDMLFWVLSMEIMIMCLLGGWLSFLGPALGAALIVLLRTFISGFTTYWGFFLGIVLMLVIFFLPNGAIGFFEEKFKGKSLKES
jgi:branched-chain amino acid transport system permease protein